MANNLVVKGGLVANSITGSLLGTASFAASSVTSSYALTANTASYVATASLALTASYVSTASYATTASFVSTASYATTAASASYINNLNQNLTITGSLTTTGNVVVQGDIIAKNYIVSSSVAYFTESFASGSTRFGDDTADTHQFTGSISTTNTITANPTGFAGGLTVNGDTIGAITLKTTGSAGFSFIADSSNGLSIYDINDTRTRFYMNDGGGFGLNTTQATGYTLSVSGSARFFHDVQVTGSVNVVGAVTASALAVDSIKPATIIAGSGSVNIPANNNIEVSVFNTTYYEGGVFDILIKSDGGTNMRMSTITVVATGGSDVSYTEVSTEDIGDTSSITVSVGNTSGNVQIRFSNNSSTDVYNIRMLPRLFPVIS